MRPTSDVYFHHGLSRETLSRHRYSSTNGARDSTTCRMSGRRAKVDCRFLLVIFKLILFFRRVQCPPGGEAWEGVREYGPHPTEQTPPADRGPQHRGLHDGEEQRDHHYKDMNHTNSFLIASKFSSSPHPLPWRNLFPFLIPPQFFSVFQQFFPLFPWFLYWCSLMKE